VVTPPIDFVGLALTSARRAFVDASPYTFIISDGTFPRHSGSYRPTGSDKVDVLATLEANPAAERQVPGRAFIALALRKVSDTFPHMITLGRTANNDLVVNDASISKLHAFFTEHPNKGFGLVDAGSRNGTFVAGAPLPSRGAAMPVRLGDRLRFGRIEFTVVDPGACWDTVDRMRR
jgi:FHA domain